MYFIGVYSSEHRWFCFCTRCLFWSSLRIGKLQSKAPLPPQHSGAPIPCYSKYLATLTGTWTIRTSLLFWADNFSTRVFSLCLACSNKDFVSSISFLILSFKSLRSCSLFRSSSLLSACNSLI